MIISVKKSSLPKSERGDKISNFIRPKRTNHTRVLIGKSMLFVIFVAVLSSCKHKGNVNELVADPKPGDVLQIKVREYNYTLYKLTRVTPDSVYLVISTYHAVKPDALDDLAAKGFDTFVNGLTRSQYEGMNIRGKILNIER